MVWCEWLEAGAEVVMLSSSMGAGAGKSPRLASSSAIALTTDIGKPRLLLDDLSGRFSCMAFAGVPEVHGTQCCLLGVERVLGVRRWCLEGLPGSGRMARKEQQP